MMGSKPELLSVDDALELLLTQALPLTEVVQVNTADALGRVLARDLQADADVPGWDNSAMGRLLTPCPEPDRNGPFLAGVAALRYKSAANPLEP